MKDDLTPEQKLEKFLSAIRICHQKGWDYAGNIARNQFHFYSPSGTLHDLSAANLEMLDEIEKRGSFLVLL